jgi:hypothetical protein
MKYSDLLEVLRDMTPEQLDHTITICDSEGEMFAGQILLAEGDDVLHDGDLFLSTMDYPKIKWKN